MTKRKKPEHPLREMQRQVEQFDRMALQSMLARFVDNGDGTVTLPKITRHVFKKR